MRKRFLPVLLVLCMVLVMLPVAAAASSEGGTGTGTTTTTPEFKLPETAGATDESALSSDKKYINNTGEGVSSETWNGKTSYYSVTAWLKYAENDLAKIDENGKVEGNMTLASAAAQLLGAKAANENSKDATVKAALAELIKTTEAKFTAIKKLDLTTKSDGTALTMTDLTPVQYFTGVEELIISGQKIQGVNPENNTTTAGLLDSHVFSALKNLTVFKADDCGLTNIDALATCTKLTTLDLSGNTGLTSVSALAGVKTGEAFNAPLDKLTTLDLSGCTALEEVGALAKCQNLTTLDISNTGVKNLNFLYVEDEDATGAAATSLSKLANLTATGLTLNVFTDASTNSISGAMQLVEKTENFKAKATKWDFGDSIKLGASTSLTNQQRQLINNFIDGMGSALTSTLTKQELTIDATLSSLSVSGTDIANISFNAATLTYDVDVPADTDTATITATPTNGYTISAVKFGNETQQGGTSALTNIDVSNDVHVQIVVSKPDDSLNQRAYVIRFAKLGKPTCTTNLQTVTDGKAEVTVSDDVAKLTIEAAAKETDTDKKIATFSVVNQDTTTEMTSATVTIGADKIQQAKTAGVPIKVELSNRVSTGTSTALVSVGSVRLSSTALGKIVDKAGTSVSSADVTIAVSKEQEVSSTIPNMDKYYQLGNFKITVSVGDKEMTPEDWGTLTTNDTSNPSNTADVADILLMFPVKRQTSSTGNTGLKVFLNGKALRDESESAGAQYYIHNGIVVVRAPHLSEVTILEDKPITTANYKVEAASGSIGSKITINGTANYYYIIQVGNSAPAPIFCLQADSQGKVVFYVSTNDASASTLKIWDTGSTTNSFTGGTPSGDLAEVPQTAE